jgi:hypothetical protein
MDEKTRKVVQFKNAEYGDKGTVRAVFATLNVIDLGGDMILPGAIGEQRVRMSAYGHRSWQGELPVGKGRVFESGDDAIFEGQFILTTTPGRDTYETVKAMGDLQEWSFALPEIESEMRTDDGRNYRAIKHVRIPEVSPVLMGQGVDTRTLEVKDLKRAFGAHSTGTDDAAWDAGANEKRVRQDEPASYYARIYAWHDPDGEVGVKSTYKFIHHFVAEGGDPGKASTRACSAGIAILNGGRGGTKIPDGDRQGVWGHLARHLRDADMEPPELRTEPEPGEIKLIDEIIRVHADAVGLAARVAALSNPRLGKARSEQLQLLVKELGDLGAAMQDAARMVEQAGTTYDELVRLYLEYQEITTRGRK